MNGITVTDLQTIYRPNRPAIMTTWHVRITATWRDERFPNLIHANATGLAFELGARVQLKPGETVGYFSVQSADLQRATKDAISRWEDIVDHAQLPAWDLTSISIEEVTFGRTL